MNGAGVFTPRRAVGAFFRSRMPLRPACGRPPRVRTLLACLLLAACSSTPPKGASGQTPRAPMIATASTLGAPAQPKAFLPLNPMAAPAPYPSSAYRPWTPPPSHRAYPFPVMTGIDVLEAEGFEPLKGLRIGLLTHPAAVDHRGQSTIEVLRHASGVRLVGLFAVEHGLYGELPAGTNFKDHVDRRTGLPVHSLYNGITHKPSRAQLAGMDALVIDLQDIGTRSYTFISAMKVALEGAFEANVQVFVLDRPNPLGGLKVDGPPMDPEWVSYVGEFRIPYVHGLTIGELARMAHEAPGVLDVPDAVRTRGRLTVVAMRGWRRAMRWPETGLSWVATSPRVPDFQAVMGYPMVGLGCEPRFNAFQHGVGPLYPFRGISCRGVRPDLVEQELRALHVPGLDFHRVSVPDPHTGQPATGLYIEVTDWDAWRPCELNFDLMRLACRLTRHNPFATMTAAERAAYLRLMGSTAFFNDIAAHGAHTDVEAYVAEWQARDKVYQKQSRRYWLYN